MGATLVLYHDARDKHVLYLAYDGGDGGLYKIDLDHDTTAQDIDEIPSDAVEIAELEKADE